MARECPLCSPLESPSPFDVISKRRAHSARAPRLVPRRPRAFKRFWRHEYSWMSLQSRSTRLGRKLTTGVGQSSIPYLCSGLPSYLSARGARKTTYHHTSPNLLRLSCVLETPSTPRSAPSSPPSQPARSLGRQVAPQSWHALIPVVRGIKTPTLVPCRTVRSRREASQPGVGRVAELRRSGAGM